jgi:tryptophan synthase beta subunit
LNRIDIKHDDVIVINLSGRGDKDLSTYITTYSNESF